MSTSNPSANMSLPIPVPSVQSGPAWAGNLNASLTIIDGHNHAPGSGVQIDPSGININTDFPFNNNNAITLKSARFTAQSAFAATTPNLLCTYVIGNDLYYNDGAGNQVRITQSGAVTGATGTITGLPSGTASAAYSAGAGKFIFQSASNIGADLDCASVIIREKVTSGKGVTLSAPSALAADYTLTLPAALPVATAFATVDNSGNVAVSVSTSGGIATSMIADGAVTQAKLAAPNYGISSSTGSFQSTSTGTVDVTNATVTVTTTGRPVEIYLTSIAAGSEVDVAATSGRAAYSAVFLIVRDSTTIGQMVIGAEQQNNETGKIIYPPGVIEALDDTVAAGSHTYKLQVACSASNTRVSVLGCKLVVKEW